MAGDGSLFYDRPVVRRGAAGPPGWARDSTRTNPTALGAKSAAAGAGARAKALFNSTSIHRKQGPMIASHPEIAASAGGALTRRIGFPIVALGLISAALATLAHA